MLEQFIPDHEKRANAFVLHVQTTIASKFPNIVIWPSGNWGKMNIDLSTEEETKQRMQGNVQAANQFRQQAHQADVASADLTLVDIMLTGKDKAELTNAIEMSNGQADKFGGTVILTGEPISTSHELLSAESVELVQDKSYLVASYYRFT